MSRQVFLSRNDKSVALHDRERAVLGVFNWNSFDWNEAKDPYCFVL